MILPDRRVTVLGSDLASRSDPASRRRLSEFRDAGAYVLLGDPGLGKTTAFSQESRRSPDARFLAVRDFLALPPGPGGTLSRTLFLDGLDEVRAAADDPRRPFDRVRGRLAGLGQRRFRLSCRPLEWLGEDDRERLETLSPDGEVVVLRLEPLDEAEIVALLDARSDLPDASGFLETAKERGLEARPGSPPLGNSLLGNPLTLGLLAEAASAGEDWPETRRATFERACRALVAEGNQQHRLLPAHPHDAPALLDAAGDLCARLLLGGATGFSLPPALGDDEYPALDAESADPRSSARAALASRLFTAGPPGRTAPAHPEIAEFLAARFLARRVERGLPGNRVIALVTGTDGAPPTALRGLAAWLAALSPPLRRRLVEADPYAVAQYGDAGVFSLDERRGLLEAIRRHRGASVADLQLGLADRLLAAPDLLDEVLTLLRSADRSESEEAALQFVLRSLPAVLPEDFVDELQRTARDLARPHETRWLAVRAFLASVPTDGGDDLLRLLRQVRAGEVPDPEDDLLGGLLRRLYPSRLTPAEVWDYLPRHGTGTESGAWSFWRVDLLERSSEAQVGELLDALSPRIPDLEPALTLRSLADLPARLLTRGLERLGDEIEVPRLCAWLRVAAVGVGQEPALWPARGPETIRRWLEARPDLQKAVLAESLEALDALDALDAPDALDDTDDLVLRIYDVRRLLYGALPPDYGRFCLDRAGAWALSRPRLAHRLLAEAVDALGRRAETERLSVALLFARAAESPRLAEWLPPLLRTDLPEGRFRRRERVLRAMAAPDPEAEEWLTEVRRHRAALLENRAPPALLFDLAAAYHERLLGARGSDPGERLDRLFRGDAELIEAARAAIRGTPARKDLPSFSEIARLPERRRRDEPSPVPWFTPAFLAAARDAADSARDGLPDWSDDRLRRLLAFHYADPPGDPDLARRLAAARPALAAEALVEIVRLELATGGAPTDPCHDLATVEDFRETARLAVPPLLRLFPTRASRSQLPALEWLLRAAIRHLDPKPLASLLEKKSRSRTLNPAQRTRWLTAGLGVSPADFRAPLWEFLDADAERTGEVAGFLFSDLPESPRVIPRDAAPETLGLLFRALGRVVRPGEWSTALFLTVGVRERTEWALGEWLDRLARDPSPEAGAALDVLVADDALEPWRRELETARERRRPLARDAAFRHPTPAQLRTALADGPPANAADLAATVADRLREVAEDLRGGDANPWRLFWNEVGIGRLPDEPKHEDSCRDALVSLLRRRLPHGVKAWPEGRYADDRRADLRLTCGDFAIPVEIKKNAHRQVWSAAWRQLAPKYATDPAGDGYAIYLVLWFGADLSPPPLDGRRANTPDEMEDRLREDLRRYLPASQAQRITVRVLDVRRPRAVEADEAFGMVAEPRAPYRVDRLAPPDR